MEARGLDLLTDALMVAADEEQCTCSLSLLIMNIMQMKGYESNTGNQRGVKGQKCETMNFYLKMPHRT